jgi:hypothetical protein
VSLKHKKTSEALVDLGVSGPGEQANELPGTNQGEQENENGREESVQPIQTISRGGRARKMSAKKAEQVESEAIKKGGRNLRKR